MTLTVASVRADSGGAGRRLRAVQDLRRHQAVPGARQPALRRRPRRDGRRPDRGAVRAGRDRRRPSHLRLAMTASAHIVTVGAMPSLRPGRRGGRRRRSPPPVVAVASRVFVEDDEAALERALGHDDALTVVLAGGGGSAGDIVRRVLARATGARLVLNERAPGRAAGALPTSRSAPAPTGGAPRAFAAGLRRCGSRTTRSRLGARRAASAPSRSSRATGASWR